MAQTQTKRGGDRSALDGHQQLEPHLPQRDGARPNISVRNVDVAGLETLIDTDGARIFFVVGFGANAPAVNLEHGFAFVALPSLGQSAPYEVWLADEPVTRSVEGGVAYARAGDILFGCITAEQGEERHLEDVTKDAYCAIFDGIDARAMPHLLRVWHYLPAINSPEDAMERYRRFSLGRHEAFVSRGRTIVLDAPAASALGSYASASANENAAAKQGGLVVYFVASAARGTPIENPRQVSAYHYPQQYGPRSPTFARALISPGEDGVFYISGTASIVGHETCHVEDVVAQTRETIANIRALQEESKRHGLAFTDAVSHMKVYVRHAEDYGVVKREVDAAFASESGIEIVYLQADICRRELLVEIEVVTHAARHAGNVS
jgi:chorismate lyase / 3-hydroxybenzoate synthase